MTSLDSHQPATGCSLHHINAHHNFTCHVQNSPSMPKASNWSHSFRFSNLNFQCISYLCYVHLTNLHIITLNISGTCPCKCHAGSRGIAPSTHTETQHQLQYHLHTGWVGPTARLTLLEHRNISFLSGNQTLNQSACSPLTVTAPSNINDKYKL